MINLWGSMMLYSMIISKYFIYFMTSRTVDVGIVESAMIGGENEKIEKEVDREILLRHVQLRASG
jgi:hypothetical protein